jgi:hypothetical protein
LSISFAVGDGGSVAGDEMMDKTKVQKRREGKEGGKLVLLLIFSFFLLPFALGLGDK